MISTEYLQYLAAFPVGALVQDVSGLGVDLHSYITARGMKEEDSLAEALSTQRVLIILL